MTLLAELQEAFTLAVLDPRRSVPSGLVGPDGESSATRFSVYRNNVFVGLIEALRASFPCVAKLVGDEFFTAMARFYAADHPPTSPVLLDYGTNFPYFIESFVPAASLPYLADVARIERAATEAYHEREECTVSLVALAGVPCGHAPHLRFRLHPSVRMVRSRFPAFTVWRMNAPDGTPGPVELCNSQDTIVLRPGADVDVRNVPPASYDFVAALAKGVTLSQATVTALAKDAQFDLSENLRQLIQMGAFAGFALDATGSDDE